MLDWKGDSKTGGDPMLKSERLLHTGKDKNERCRLRSGISLCRKKTTRTRLRLQYEMQEANSKTPEKKVKDRMIEGMAQSYRKHPTPVESRARPSLSLGRKGERSRTKIRSTGKDRGISSHRKEGTNCIGESIKQQNLRGKNRP